MQYTRIKTGLDIISDRKGAFALLASLFLLVITVAGYAGLFYLNKSQENAQTQFVQQIQQKEDDLRPKLLDQIFALQKRIQTVSGVISSHGFAAHTFSALERDTHPRVRFNKYTFAPKDRTIVLTGEADDFGVLARQIAFLEGDQQINKVEFGGLALSEENNHVLFNLTIHAMPSLTAAPQ